MKHEDVGNGRRADKLPGRRGEFRSGVGIAWWQALSSWLSGLTVRIIKIGYGLSVA